MVVYTIVEDKDFIEFEDPGERWDRYRIYREGELVVTVNFRLSDSFSFDNYIEVLIDKKFFIKYKLKKIKLFKKWKLYNYTKYKFSYDIKKADFSDFEKWAETYSSKAWLIWNNIREILEAWEIEVDLGEDGEDPSFISKKH